MAGQCHGRHKKHEGIVEGKRGKSIKIDMRFLNFSGCEQTILSIEQKSRPWKNNGTRHTVLHYNAKHKRTFITNDQGTIIKDDRKLGSGYNKKYSTGESMELLRMGFMAYPHRVKSGQINNH